MARPGRKPKQQQEVDLAQMLAQVGNSLGKQSRKPNILGYRPHQKQAYFHEMQRRKRLYIGGNRSGKSYGAVAEDIWWASGTHPHIDIKERYPYEEIRGRVVAVDMARGVRQIILPIFKILTPDSFLHGGSWDKAWSQADSTLHFKYNNSYIEFMSYEQDTEKFAGTSRHFIHYDEEPPQNIYNECQARLVDTFGSSWISMTPIEGITWVFDKIYDPANESEAKKILLEGDEKIGPVWENPKENLGVIEVGMNENPHLSDEAREEYLRDLDDDERRARSKGHFVQTAGRVFKSFQVETHVEKGNVDPRGLQRAGWQIYTSTDHGWNNPTAWLWHAVSPSDRVITFGEHYEAEMTIDEHAKKVKEMEKEWGLDVTAIMRTGDPAMNQHNAVTGTTIIQEYTRRGLYIYTDSVPRDPGIGMGRMQMYFKLREDGHPKWMISDGCPNFIGELRRLRFKKYSSAKMRYENNPQEQVHKKDDHAFDSAKYFATFLPELAPIKEDKKTSRETRNDTITYDESLTSQLQPYRSEMDTEWTVLETYGS